MRIKLRHRKGKQQDTLLKSLNEVGEIIKKETDKANIHKQELAIVLEHKVTKIDFFQAVCEALLKMFPSLKDAQSVVAFHQRLEQAEKEMKELQDAKDKSPG